MTPWQWIASVLFTMAMVLVAYLAGRRHGASPRPQVAETRRADVAEALAAHVEAEARLEDLPDEEFNAEVDRVADGLLRGGPGGARGLGPR